MSTQHTSQPIQLQVTPLELGMIRGALETHIDSINRRIIRSTEGEVKDTLRTVQKRYTEFAEKMRRYETP